MKTFKFPLLIWQLQEAYYGFLPTYGYEHIELDKDKLKTRLVEHLQRVYNNQGYLSNDFANARMKKIKVHIRPAYTEMHGTYPIAEKITLSVIAIYNDIAENGIGNCYLPLLQEHFFYYHQEQLDTLIEHFASSAFYNKTPEDLHQFLLIPIPELEEITVRVKEKEIKHKYTTSFRQQLPSLSRIADVYPQKQSGELIPEAAWERGDIVNQLVDKIIKENSSILLIGEHGIGKTAILIEVSRRILQQTKDRHMPMRFWRTTPHRMISGAKYLGEWQQAVEEILDELEYSHNILWVNDFIHLLEIGGSGPEDSIAAFLLPRLKQGHIRIVAELTQQEWDAARRILPGFIAYCQRVEVPALHKKQIFNIMQQLSDYVSKQMLITIEDNAKHLAYRLLDRYLSYEAFPGKVMHFLRQCVDNALVNHENNVTDKEIVQQFVLKTGLPEILLRDEIILKKADLKYYFAQHIKGQDQAIDYLCNVITIFKAGLNHPHKPIATLIFAGPTGVGKTASAKALAEYFFGQGQTLHPLIRLDMSEFQHPAQLHRLIGGDDTPGKLIQSLRERPFSVVLLDEIEKANPVFFDILLNILDEGILVDNFGRITDFRNSILIMTTNLGAKTGNSLGFSNPQGFDALSNIKQFFRPEFYNRIDQVIPFQALNQETIKQITQKELIDLEKRPGIKERNIHLSFSDQVIEHLAKIGFHPDYGARPLQRMIEQNLVAKLGVFLLKNNIFNQKIFIDFEGEIVCKIC